MVERHNMKKLKEIIEIVSGSPQFRIKEAFDDFAPIYVYYGQSEIEDDLVDMNLNKNEDKKVRTLDDVITVNEGDVVFSLVSGKATLVRKAHQGYLLTQNYVTFNLNHELDDKYFIYLLNEDDSIKKQLKMSLQGSNVLKYTLKQVRELELPKTIAHANQKLIGEVYFNQIRLQALKQQAALLETTYILEKIKKVENNE